MNILDFSETAIIELAIHRVGNRLHNEGYFLSKKRTDVRDSDAHVRLLKFFTAEFGSPEFYQFTHPTDTVNNDVYKVASQVFDKKEDFLDASSDLAKLLYSQSNHPKIMGGELYIVNFNKLVYNGESINAIGIFKSESKTPFMKIVHKSDIYEYEFDEGIDLKTVDKACLVLNAESEDGYRVCIYDKQGKGEDALYWKEDFLGLKPCSDSYHKTRQFLNMCSSYIKDQLPQEFEVNKTDQIDLLNKSVSFFKANENFDYQAFTREVIEEPHIKNSFTKYKQEFEKTNDLELGTDFEISASAVKRDAKVFKSILKLDKNFHVYVHGSKDMIERGFDEDKKMNFYKLYYNVEN